MIGGPSCDGRNSSRFAEGYTPAKDEQRGHALRLASDDLYDCGWKTTHTFPLPADLKPGIYVARIRYGEDFQRFYDVTFVVRRARGLPRSPLLVLCATNTWLAYSGTPFAPNHTEKDPRQIWNIYGKQESDEGQAPRKTECDSFRGGGTDNCEYAWFVWPGHVRKRATGKVSVLGRTHR